MNQMTFQAHFKKSYLCAVIKSTIIVRLFWILTFFHGIKCDYWLISSSNAIEQNWSSGRNIHFIDWNNFPPNTNSSLFIYNMLYLRQLAQASPLHPCQRRRCSIWPIVQYWCPRRYYLHVAIASSFYLCVMNSLAT